MTRHHYYARTRTHSMLVLLYVVRVGSDAEAELWAWQRKARQAGQPRRLQRITYREARRMVSEGRAEYLPLYCPGRPAEQQPHTVAGRRLECILASNSALLTRRLCRGASISPPAVRPSDAAPWPAPARPARRQAAAAG